MLCILGGGDPPPPIYHLSVTQQVDDWHGRAPARHPADSGQVNVTDCRLS